MTRVMNEWEAHLKALDEAYRVFCDINDAPGSVSALKEAIDTYNRIVREYKDEDQRVSEA
jgi:hypothetical protein